MRTEVETKKKICSFIFNVEVIQLHVFILST